MSRRFCYGKEAKEAKVLSHRIIGGEGSPVLPAKQGELASLLDARREINDR